MLKLTIFLRAALFSCSFRLAETCRNSQKEAEQAEEPSRCATSALTVWEEHHLQHKGKVIDLALNVKSRPHGSAWLTGGTQRWRCWYHHGLLDAQVRQQHVVLHDVARNLPEGTQVSGPTVDQDLAFHPRLPGNGAELPESRTGAD